MFIRLVTLWCLLSLGSAWAAPLKPEQVPEPLKPWVDWVMQDETQHDCPYAYNEEQRNCAWPSQLDLQLTDKGGSFSQQWQVFGQSALVRLAGNKDHWPQKIRSDGQDILVQSKRGLPYVKLSQGVHQITGEFVWNKLPKSLYVTPEAGLIQLQINGKKVSQPVFNQQGQLWLTQGKSEVQSEDNLDIQVFRKIKDSHPIQVITTIKLRVSGKQRNVTLSPVLLDGFIPQSIKSKLPARIEGKQTLQVQLRAGEWSLDIVGRAPSDVVAFTSPKRAAPWPDQEVWVFEANHQMRQVQVSGANSIDPNQTHLPNAWKKLPAYLMQPEQTLKLDVMHRGAAKTSRDELRLNREIWLDFDGDGYTIKDQLNGTVPQINRLNMTKEFQLGRVSVDGQPQFITQDKQGLAGVELRRDRVNVSAESRYEGDVSTLPINGWQQDLQRVNTTLHLPAGWRLFSASDTDNSPQGWVQKWSLLDLFLVLIIALAMGYIYNWKWGLFTLVTLVMVWHESSAPRMIWLNLLAVTALLKVLPLNKFDGLRKGLVAYRWLSLFVLATILLPYMINTVRIALYPQLEAGYYAQPSHTQGQVANMAMDEPVLEEAYSDVTMELKSAARMSKKAAQYAQKRIAPAPKKALKQKADLQAIDPNSMIQTGFGLPQWRGAKTFSLYWSGPIKADETSQLIFISPKVNLVLKFLGILFLLALTWRFVSRTESWSWSPKQWFKASPAVLACALVPALWLQPDTVQAETIPNPAILEELKERLTATPDCLPECAQIEQMRLAVTDNTLQVRLRVHAAEETAIPLLGRQEAWLAQYVWIDGEAAKAIQRDEKQQLWVVVPQGLHEVILSGALPQRNTVTLPLPLKPHLVHWQDNNPQWTLDGVKENGTPESQLQLNRVLNEQEKQLVEQSQNTLPTFVKVKRQLSLGLDWYVETTVTRVSPQNVPLRLSIPLLANEQPLEQLSIRNNQVRLNFQAQQKTISWSSRLKITDKLELVAANSSRYLETWKIDSNPVWHVAASGLPVNQFHNDGMHTIPVWSPWPNEKLTLDISRPKGLAGQTVTILDSKLEIISGKRAKDVTLSLSILSSRGVQHKIKLPENAQVQSVTIDDTAQRIQQAKGSLSLTLKPKQQHVEVKWREDEALSFWYRFPEVDLGLPSVNSRQNLELSSDHWVLWVSGPTQGPAILFWGILLVLLIIALILGKSKLTPLKTWQWFLLGIGLSQTTPFLILLFIAWLVAIALREKLSVELKYWQFNMMQLALAGLTFFALLILASSVANGLLGRPDMQIVGNASSSFNLNWYQDRVAAVLPQPLVVSVSLWVYRVLMLLWALWLAIAVLQWLRWGWHAINVGGLWQSKPKVLKTPDLPKQEK